MHKIDGLDATPDGRFQDPNPPTGILGTVLTAKWLNAVQEELVHPVERAQIPLDDGDNAQVLQALQAIYGSGVSGGSLKNVLVNGGFDLWQRGLSRATTFAEVYTADRWAIRADAAAGGSGTGVASRQDFAPGQTDVPGALRFLRYVQSTIAVNGAPAIVQRIEDLPRFSGVTVSISFSCRAAAAMGGALRLFVVPGAGGSADIQIAVEAITITTAWQRFAFSYAIPNLASVTLGSFPHLRTSITLAVGTTYTFELADFQLEVSDQASAFDRRPLALEYLLAARYFQKSYPLDVQPGTDGGSPADAMRGAGITKAVLSFEPGTVTPNGWEWWYGLQARLPIPMRASPTVTWFKPATVGTSARVVLQETPPVDLTVLENVAGADSSTGFPHTSTPIGPFTAGNIPHAAAHWTADAEI